jgi:hypothetical protein
VLSSAVNDRPASVASGAGRVYFGIHHVTLLASIHSDDRDRLLAFAAYAYTAPFVGASPGYAYYKNVKQNHVFAPVTSGASIKSYHACNINCIHTNICMEY